MNGILCRRELRIRTDNNWKIVTFHTHADASQAGHSKSRQHPGCVCLTSAKLLELLRDDNWQK